jgi:hypothetical protein
VWEKELGEWKRRGQRGKNVTASIHYSYIVPFDPLGAPGPTILTTTQNYNRGFKCLKWGSVMTPYPDLAEVYCWSAIPNPGDDMFEDLWLHDMWVCRLLALCAMLMICHRVQVNKRISHHWLLHDADVLGNLRGLLERGIQVKMDSEEVRDDTVDVAIGYAGAVGTRLWSIMKEDRAQVCPGYGESLLTWLTWSRWTGWISIWLD